MSTSEPFTGEYRHAIDAKSRLTVPSKLREVIYPREQATAFFAVAEYDRAIYLYTPEAYRQVSPAIGAADRTNPKARAFQRVYYGFSERLDVDRLGRILLPERFLKRCGIGKNVAIIGAGDHLEVWDEARWDAWLDEVYASRDELAVDVSRWLEEKAAAKAAAAKAAVAAGGVAEPPAEAPPDGP